MSRMLSVDATQFRAFLKTRPRIVLGSYSSSRRAVLDEIVKEYDTMTYELVAPDIDEKSIRFDDPQRLVLELGVAKAKAVLGRDVANAWRGEDTYLITADQVVVHEDQILEKPESEAEVKNNAKGFARTPARTGGNAFVGIDWEWMLHHIDIAIIYMDAIPDANIERLIQEGAVFRSAGGLLAEHPLVAPYVRRIEGGLDMVMGLSKNTVMALLVQTWQRVQTS